MNLNGSIADLQKAAIQLYLKLQQRFKGNVLIRELWSSMANDLSQQKDTLKALPPSFWNQLQKEHSELHQAVIPYARLQVTDNIKDTPLKSCIEGALQFEEPTILKIYIPIIRSLRENLTTPALEFYIMVKAHLARIARMTSSFSGDPIIIQRSSLLMQSFEREIQEPPVEVMVPSRKAAKATKKSAKSGVSAEKRRAKPVKSKKAVAKPPAKAAKTAAKAAKTAAKPAKKARKAAKAAKRSVKKAPKLKKAVVRKPAKPKKMVARKAARPKKAAAKPAAKAAKPAAKAAKPAAKAAKPAAKAAKPAAKAVKTAKKAAKRSSTLSKRTKTRHHRTKPLAKKVSLPRGRARARR